jgi:hypothetical protein
MYYQSWSKSDDLVEPLKQIYNIKEMFYELLEIAWFHEHLNSHYLHDWNVLPIYVNYQCPHHIMYDASWCNVERQK